MLYSRHVYLQRVKFYVLVRSGEGVLSISTFEGGKAESIEVAITSESPVAGKQLKDIRLPGKALVGNFTW